MITFQLEIGEIRTGHPAQGQGNGTPTIIGWQIIVRIRQELLFVLFTAKQILQLLMFDKEIKPSRHWAIG